jgi:hypothetical protein
MEDDYDGNHQLWSALGYDALAVIWGLNFSDLRRLRDDDLRLLVRFTGWLQCQPGREAGGGLMLDICECYDPTKRLQLLQDAARLQLDRLGTAPENQHQLAGLPQQQDKKSHAEPRREPLADMTAEFASEDREMWSTLGYDTLAIIWDIDPTSLHQVPDCELREITAFTLNVGDSERRWLIEANSPLPGPSGRLARLREIASAARSRERSEVAQKAVGSTTASEQTGSTGRVPHTKPQGSRQHHSDRERPCGCQSRSQ